MKVARLAGGLAESISLLLLACGDSSFWNAKLSASQIETTTVGETTYASSSKLLLNWTAPALNVDHYVITATESSDSSKVTSIANAGDTSATVTGLKSGATYTLNLKACLDANCDKTKTPVDGDASASTEEEYWQLQGTDNTVRDLTKVVSDGNSKISALFYGDDADLSLAGKVQLYYGPLGSTVKGLAVGTMDSAPESEEISSYLSFTALSGSAGLINPSTATSLIQEVNTGEAIPLSAEMGSKIRLFFEATGSDSKTRILYLDSQDGYLGQDFNSKSSDTVCHTSAEYQSSGTCGPTVAIGVSSDSVKGNTGVDNARQFKIGYPTLDDWRWDGNEGTFMIFTVETSQSCSSANKKQGYAVWDGSEWNVQYEETDTACPKLFENMQAPALVHRGGVTYKLYFGDPSVTTGIISGSSLPFLGPKLVMYADGVLTGETDRVDYEDWDDRLSARATHFLWPSGTELNDEEEGYIDDFMMLTPTSDLDFQIMYMAITDGKDPPISAAAVLLNP